MTVPTLPPAVDGGDGGDGHGEGPAPGRSAARRPRRVRYVVAGLLCVAAVVALLVGALARNVVYFRTVSEAIERRADDGGARVRVAGEVVPGTVVETADGVEFEITDGARTMRVLHRGDPPQLFADGVPVVCEGRWGDGDAFASDRILIRHGNEYSPPAVDSDRAPAAAGP